MSAPHEVIDEAQLGGLAQAAGVDTVRTILDAFWASTEEISVELCNAMDTGDTSSMAKLGHALKGSSANVGAALMADRAKLIEEAAISGDVIAAKQAMSAFVEDIERTRVAIEDLLLSVA